MKPRISKQEFQNRILKMRKYMEANDIDAILVYGDEYRKEI